MKTVILNESTFVDSLAVAAEAIRHGGLVVFPTDTVYGLLVDATNVAAVKKLISFKERPPGKAISTFVLDSAMIETLCVVPVEKKPLLRRLLPGPYTLILESRHLVSTLLESETGTLGVRIPDSKPVNSLMQIVTTPVTATSANLGGQSPHYSIESFLDGLPVKKRELIDLIVDAGKLPRNKPSTVIDLTTPEPKLLRKGDVLISNSQTFISHSPEETGAIAKDTLSALLKSGTEKIVFILKGDLGSGKTQWAKAVADALGIRDVVSPTYVIYYEYPIPSSPTFTNLYHFDLYNIQSDEEFNHLGLEQINKPGTIAIIEWGEKLGDSFELFKNDSEAVLVEMEHVNENTRTITVNYLS